MRPRSPSPTASLAGFDISAALATDPGAQGPHGSGGLSVAEGVDLGSESDGDDLFIAATQAAANRKNASSSAVKKSGGFHAFGLSTNLGKAISAKGFRMPTPIQRKTIPIILDGRDVVGMARTGSGKTAAFVIPMIEKLKAHSAKVGARAIVLSPSRELALQTLKVVKELGKGTDLRTVLLVGGDSLEDQFSSMVSNPDIIIATPGRFEHLKIEMGLELSSVRYVVFDEADRLFEMGFAAQLTEIIHSLPPNRQTLLFSATLPKTLVEFARAGLQEPQLVRLDSESKISPDLQSAFFMINSSDKEGALLHILNQVIKMPTGLTPAAAKAHEQARGDNKKRKRGIDRPNMNETPTAHSTIVFVATKHHVDYIAGLLKHVGYATSYVYGSLDQTARRTQTEDFRTGMTNIMVVTDVAARGIDIPILANVINYDLPPQPKVFIHRVGRTARAGKTGWSYNLVTAKDLPYLLDLQLFLGGNMVLGRESESPDYHNNIHLGAFPKEGLERAVEEVNKLVDGDDDLTGQKGVASKGEMQYLRTRNASSAESAKRAKSITSAARAKELHPLFSGATDVKNDDLREQLLAKVRAFRPQETVFEVGKRGQTNATIDTIKKQRSNIARRKKQDEEARKAAAPDAESDGDEPHSHAVVEAPDADNDSEIESDLEVTISQPSKRTKSNDYQDEEHFMGYLPTSINMAEDAGYNVNDSFVSAARSATMDLNADESSSFALASKPTGLRWDKKSKRYVARANDIDGSRATAKGKGAMVRTESGTKVPGSMKSGRFENWKKANRVRQVPRVGDVEKPGRLGGGGSSTEGKRFRHRKVQAPKEADRYRDDYFSKRKRAKERKEADGGATSYPAGRGHKGKKELRSVDDVRKLRQQKDKRKEKNARPRRKTA